MKSDSEQKKETYKHKKKKYALIKLLVCDHRSVDEILRKPIRNFQKNENNPVKNVKEIVIVISWLFQFYFFFKQDYITSLDISFLDPKILLVYV